MEQCSAAGTIFGNQKVFVEMANSPRAATLELPGDRMIRVGLV